MDHRPSIACVAIVGAGPGAVDLLTLRAVERLRAADDVVHDRLVGPEILDYCRPDAARHDVGKGPEACGDTQAAINTLLVDLAHRGRRVVRLKGGDPYVFGRGGEEVLALQRAGIPYEVVPGVSAALAAPAAAGIPLTHRGLASAFTVATGTAAGGADVDEDHARRLAATPGTLVLLMAVKRLERLTTMLLRHGRAPDEPAALVSRATWPGQAVVRAPLAELACRARDHALTSPSALVVGPTAALTLD